MDIGEKTRLSRLLKNGRALFLAMDQGIEHGPSDFNDKNIDPDYILKIAEKGYTGMILHKGVALKYFENYAGKVPLILKLNARTSIPSDDKEEISAQITSVKDAVRLGADAVGFTIYVGVEEEPLMLKQFGKIEEEARDYGLPVLAWMYPRGENKNKPEIITYAARLGMELGADMIKTYYVNKTSFEKTVKACPNTKILASGGTKKSANKILEEAYNVIKTGGCGMAIGRNVWQSNNPYRITKALQSIIFKNYTAEQALKLLK